MIALNIKLENGLSVRCYLDKIEVYWHASDLIHVLCKRTKVPMKLLQLKDLIPNNRQTLLMTRYDIDKLTNSNFEPMKTFLTDVEKRGLSVPELFNTIFKTREGEIIYLDATLGGYGLESIRTLVNLPLRSSLRTLLEIDNFKNFTPAFLALVRHLKVPHKTLLDQIRVECNPIVDEVERMNSKEIDELSRHLTLHTIEYCESGISKNYFLEPIIRSGLVEQMRHIQKLHFPKLKSKQIWNPTISRWETDDLESFYLDMFEILKEEAISRVHEYHMQGKIKDDVVLHNVGPEYF